ncbi:DUF4873 domain-containing protein [Nocardioides sp.]|uniref:DUF4873 domain-containing protein n=1 Tax=Nocardioides sp. TaxID=35761 RepID=UPI0027339473|nr:DUF4873 domain-containing protein [Nocardioides sp.]MDP3892947.1 DUF4873 domain-containing protein [Nocardioides sp.]
MTSTTSEEHHEAGAAYSGPAGILTGGDSPREPITVRVDLRGAFQPIDGRFHWYGRLEASPEVAAAAGTGAVVTLRTPHGEAGGRLSDLDPWGRLRVTGVGRPPF